MWKKDGQSHKMRELHIADDSGAQIVVSLWDKATEYVDTLLPGCAASFLGITAMKMDGENVKLNMWGKCICVQGWR